MIYTTDLGVDKFHNGLLEIVQVHGILGRCTGNDVVFVVIVTTHSRKLLGIRKLDVHTILLHDALDAATSDADDTLMVGLRNVERDLGRQFLLEKGKSLQDRCVIAGDVDQEVVFVESLNLNLHVSSLHDLVNLAVLLATDEVTMLVGQLQLESHFMMIVLRERQRKDGEERVHWRTLTISSSKII